MTKYPGGQYLVVLNMAEARLVCDFIEGRPARRACANGWRGNVSPGFDFARDLVRVGVANQTTMLAGESLAIAEEFRAVDDAPVRAEAIDAHFRTFDTICSATQERQDAVLRLLEEPLDADGGDRRLQLQQHLPPGQLCHHRGVRTYHVEDAHCIGLDGTIRHQPVGSKQEVEDAGWLDGDRPDRDYGGRLHAEQQDRRDHRPDLRGGGVERGTGCDGVSRESGVGSQGSGVRSQESGASYCPVPPRPPRPALILEV